MFVHRISYCPDWLCHRILPLVVCLLLLTSLTAAATRHNPPEPGYVGALITTNHFLQAWQSGDAETGTALLTSRAKKTETAESIEQFFSNAISSAYEIGRGKMLKRRVYEFPIVLVSRSSKDSHIRRRFTSIIVLNGASGDWVVDKLP
jgi:hypothetical protein